MQFEDFNLKAKRTMFSRVGILSVRAHTVAPRTTEAVKLPYLLMNRERTQTPLNQRIDRAVKEVEDSITEAKKLERPRRPDLSTSFSSVSREKANPIKNTEFPTPTQYSPNYKYLMRSMPQIIIPKPKRVGAQAQGRSSSIENRIPTHQVREGKFSARTVYERLSVLSSTHV